MYLFEHSRKSLQLMFCYDFDFLIIKNFNSLSWYDFREFQSPVAQSYKQTFPDFPGLVQILEKW